MFTCPMRKSSPTAFACVPDPIDIHIDAVQRMRQTCHQVGGDPSLELTLRDVSERIFEKLLARNSLNTSSQRKPRLLSSSRVLQPETS